MNELSEIEVIAEETTALTITDKIKAALHRDLGPVATRMAGYSAFAAAVKCENVGDAKAASGFVEGIDQDLKLVKENEVLSSIIDGLYRLHRHSTAFRAMFTDPMERDKKLIRAPVLAWQEAEQKKAEDLQRRLQAEANARTERERQALLKKADAVKSPALQESYREQASQVVPPVVAVEAPKSNIRISHRWRVQAIQLDSFFNALAHDDTLRGYVKIEETRMERSKAINPNLEI